MPVPKKIKTILMKGMNDLLERDLKKRGIDKKKDKYWKHIKILEKRFSRIYKSIKQPEIEKDLKIFTWKNVESLNKCFIDGVIVVLARNKEDALKKVKYELNNLNMWEEEGINK